jgi:nicotinamide riboside transporter PnuC
MKYVPWVLSFLSIVGAIMNIKVMPSCFIVWTLTNIGWIILNVKTKLWGQIPLWIVFTALNIYGYFSWTGMLVPAISF